MTCGVSGGHRLCLVVVGLAVAANARFAAAQTASDPGALDAGVVDAAAAQGKIEVAGASGDGSAAPAALTFAAIGDTFEYRLLVEEVAGAPVDKVELSVTPLVDDRGAQHALSWGSEGGAIEPRGRGVVAQPVAASTQLTIVFRASLPELGTYKATVTPYWNKTAHQRIALTVTRARGALNLEVRDPDPLAQTGNLDQIAFGAVLQATEDRGVRLKTPLLRSLVEIRGADAAAKRFSAPGELTVKDGEKVLKPGDSLEIEPHATRSLRFELEHLPGPGHYEATLRFASADAPPLDKAFPIYLRQHAWVALLWILAGVVLSWFLRWFVMNERPRVANQQAVLALIDEAKECLEVPGIDEDGRSLVASVRRELRGVLSGFLVKLDAQDQDRIAALGLKVQLVRKWLVLRPSVHAIASPDVRKTYETQLDDIARELRRTDATTDTLKTHGATLDGLPAAIRVAVDKDLEARATALDKDLDAATKALPAGRLRVELQNIQVRLKTSGGAASFEALVRAQKDFVMALVGDLLRRLDERPAYVDKATWPEIVSVVRDLVAPARTLEPAAAREVYRVAYAEYLRRLIEAQAQLLDKARKDKLDDKILAPLVQRFDAIMSLLGEGTLEKADAAIAALSTDLIAALAGGGGKMDSAPPRAPGTPAESQVPSVPEFLPVAPFDAPTLATTEEIAARRIRRAWTIELLVNVIVLVVAAIIGMKVLYIDDLTWGGWGSYLTAGLWGLGLHQFTYGGVGGLFDRFTTGRTAGAGAT